MKIESITLKNFRCFGDSTTTIALDDVTTLIGPNGAGKSAALLALCRVFGTTQRGLQREDFHVPPLTPGQAPPKSITLAIDLRLSFPELSSGASGGTAVPQCFRQMAIDRPGGVPFCRIRLEGTWTSTNLADGEIEERLWWVRTSEEVPLEEHRTEFKGRDRSLIHVIYIPATRDPSQQIRAASVTLLGRLLNVIEWPESLRKDVAQEAASLDELITATQAIETIQTSLAERWRALHSENLYANPALQFTVGELEDILRRVQIGFGPTPGALQDDLKCLSDGMKSLFYFALVTAVFDVERAVAAKALAEPENQDFDLERLAPPALTVLAVEEPENHVAPQLLGRIMQLLDAVARAPEGQVVLTSHSPGILSRVDPANVRYLRLAVTAQQRTTEVRAIILPQARDEVYKYVKEAVRAYPELYFAQLVIFGEGDSEEIVIPRILRSAGIGLDAQAIAVVPLGGRHVNHLWKLAAGLSIPHVTLLDLDAERAGGGSGRIRTACKELLAIGVPRSPLLDTEDGTLTDEELDALSINHKDLRPWVAELEKYGVFFSGPLDIDLLMLEAYPDAYKAVGARGPQLPEPGTPDYDERLAKAARRVLGDEGGDSGAYTPEQRALFPWYTYLFLGRGKPATHVLALARLDDTAIEASLPAVLKRLRKQIADMT